MDTIWAAFGIFWLLFVKKERLVSNLRKVKNMTKEKAQQIFYSHSSNNEDRKDHAREGCWMAADLDLVY